MSRIQTKAITREELETLMKGLGISSKVELAQKCGVSASAVGFYFKKDAEVPISRLKRLAIPLHEIIKKSGGPTSEQRQALELLESKTNMKMEELISEAKGMLLIEAAAGSALPSAKASTFYSDSEKAQECVVAGRLSQYSLEDLTDEISRRGWAVTLNRKVSE